MKPRKPRKKILIINLTRMGDLLQMTPFLSGSRQEHPEAKITLLVLDEFHDICSGFPFVDEVETFDARDYISKLNDPNGSLIESFRVLEELVERLRQRQFDAIINLTFSRLSALLTYLLKAKDVRGITIDDQGNRLVKDPWINHLYNVVTKREINLFNYVDFIRKAGGSPRRSAMRLAVSESDRGFAKAFCEGHGIGLSDRLIGFQPGASRDSRRWPTKSFGDLAADLIKQGAKVVLFGSGSEKELGQKIRDVLARHLDPMGNDFFDMIGKTTVNQLAALLERCNLLITGDTGTMHVATAVGTQVVALFFGPAYFPETGPYGDRHIVIQSQEACAPCEHSVRCRNPRCRESISVSHVLRVSQMVLGGFLEKEQQLEDWSEWDGVQLYRGAFDKDEMLEFCPVIRRPIRRMDLIRQIYRDMWKTVLDRRPGQIDPVHVMEKIHSRFVVDGIPLNIEEDCKAFEGTVELARQGIEMSQRLVRWSKNTEQNIAAIKTAGQVIHDIDEQIDLLGRTQQACHPLAYMFRQGKENLEEGDVGSLSRKTRQLYRTLFREATLMKHGLEETVACLEGSS